MGDKRKGLYFEVVSYKELFNNLSRPPLLINDFDTTSKEGREELNAAIVSKFEGDHFANTPMCLCGKYNGERFRHVECEVCGSVVDYLTERPIESMLWMRVPKCLPAFFNLTIWRFLRKRLRIPGRFSVLDYLCDPYYKHRTGGAPHPVISKLASLGIERGMTNFINNYERYITLLHENRILGQNKPVAVRNRAYEFLMDNLDKTFFEYLPFPSKLLFITESHNGTTYADPTMEKAIDAALAFARMDVPGKNMSRKQVESRTTVALSMLDDFYVGYEKDVLLGKPGVLRKLVFGTKPLFVFRAVITSISEPHYYDQLEFPWSLSVSLFTLHIANVLLKRNFSPQEIMTLISESSLRTHPLVESILDEIIEGGVRPITTTWLRNPSMQRGSYEAPKAISRVKKDPFDNTIGVSNNVLNMKNADFDGDQLAGFLLLCKKWEEGFGRIATHLTIMDTDKAFKFSNALDIPKPQILTIDHWLSDESPAETEYL